MKQIKSGAKFYRFEAFQRHGTGADEQKRIVGSGSVREGDSLISLRLFTFMNERFYVVISREDPSECLIMTREPNRNTKSTNKYFWHIIGHGRIYPLTRLYELKFDLFEKVIFLDVHFEDQPVLTADENEAS